MNYATIKRCDIANGPGVRVSLFVSGCTHRCPGCFNEEAWDFEYGRPFTQQTIDEILEMLRPSHIKGLTLLGGEPFEPENQEGLIAFMRRVKEQYPKKDVWAYTGYTWEALQAAADPARLALLRAVDVLVDGPFLLDQRSLELTFCGSRNQRLIDVPASLAAGEIVLWQDWQAQGKGLRK